MGRKSKLTEVQWGDILRRSLDGESIRALAREFGVAESSVREKISAQSAQIKTVANQIVATEQALKSLPIAAQINAHNLAAKLQAISGHMATGAEYHAATFNRLSLLASKQVQLIDEGNPVGDGDLLRGVAALTSLANEAAKTPLALLTANKASMEADKDKPVDDDARANQIAARLEASHAARADSGVTA